MRTAGMIEVTGCDLATLVRAAYSPSRQQGLGHYDPRGRSELTDAMVESVLERGRDDPMCAIGLDYLNGRSVKMHVYKDGDRLFINNRWYDHGDDELAYLLERIGVPAVTIQKARDEEVAHKERVKAMALDYLRERGGEVRQNRGLKSLPKPEEELPTDVDEGLWIAYFEKLVSETYGADGITTWKLV